MPGSGLEPNGSLREAPDSQIDPAKTSLLFGLGVHLRFHLTPGRSMRVLRILSILFFGSFQGLASFYEDGLPTWLWGVRGE